MFHFWHRWDGIVDIGYYPRPQCVICDTKYRWWKFGTEYIGIPAAAYERRREILLLKDAKWRANHSICPACAGPLKWFVIRHTALCDGRCGKVWTVAALDRVL